jgi:hypothetical protein
MTVKFSDNYIELIKNEDDETTSFNIKKKFIIYDSKLSIQWRHITNTILFDYKCIHNKTLSKIKDLCFNIEKIIEKDNFTEENIRNNIIFPSEHYIVKYLLPHLDELSLEDIKDLYNAQKVADGPLYEQFKSIRLPIIFIDLFSQL